MSGQVPPEMAKQIADEVFAGNKISAIRLYREFSGKGLKESKEFVEALEAELRGKEPGKFTASPKGKGCLGMAIACLVSAVFVVAVLVALRR